MIDPSTVVLEGEGSARGLIGGAAKVCDGRLGSAGGAAAGGAVTGGAATTGAAATGGAAAGSGAGTAADSVPDHAGRLLGSIHSPQNRHLAARS